MPFLPSDYNPWTHWQFSHAVVADQTFLPPLFCLQRPRRFWAQAGQDLLIDSGSGAGCDSNVISRRRSQLLRGDSGDFGATMTPGVDPASVSAASAGGATRPPRKMTVERFFFADDGDSGLPGPVAHAITPVPSEAGEAGEAASDAAAAAAATTATRSAKARAQTTAAITETTAALFLSSAKTTSPADGGMRGTHRNAEVKKQHHHDSRVPTSILPRAPNPADRSYKSKCLGHCQSSPMARISALAARAKFSSDLDENGFFSDNMDEQGAEGDGDDGRVLGRHVPPGMAAAVTAAAAASSSGLIFSSVSSVFNSEQGREYGNRALQALALEITGSSKWTVAIDDPIKTINNSGATTGTPTATATATAAPSPLMLHTSASTSSDEPAMYLVASAVPPRTDSLSRAVVGTDDDDGGDDEETLGFLSDVSDSDQSEIMTASSTIDSSKMSGGTPTPSSKPLARAKYVSSSSVSWASSSQEHEAGAVSTDNSDAAVLGDSQRSGGTSSGSSGGKASATTSFQLDVEWPPSVVAGEEAPCTAYLEGDSPLPFAEARLGPRLGPSPSMTTSSEDVDELVRRCLDWVSIPAQCTV